MRVKLKDSEKTVSGIIIKNLTTDVQKEYMFCEKTDSDQLIFFCQSMISIIKFFSLCVSFSYS